MKKIFKKTPAKIPKTYKKPATSVELSWQKFVQKKSAITNIM